MPEVPRVERGLKILSPTVSHLMAGRSATAMEKLRERRRRRVYRPADQHPAAAAGLCGKFGGLPTYSRALSATLLA